MRRPILTTLTLLAGAFFFIVNPALLTGCEDPYQFGQKEMSAKLEKLQTTEYMVQDSPFVVKITMAAGKSVKKTMDFDRDIAIFSSATACGTRSFVAPAAACVDSTEMSLKGSFSLLERAADGSTKAIAEDVPVLGMYTVNGKTLNNGMVDFGANDLSGTLTYTAVSGAFELSSFVYLAGKEPVRLD